MKLKLISSYQSPDYYTFDGDVITAHSGDVSESFDLSALVHGDKFEGVEPDTLTLNPAHIIRDAYRDDSGVLHVTLCQAVGPGHWSESAEIDSADYDPDAIHVPFVKAAAGKPWALTRQGHTEPEVTS